MTMLAIAMRTMLAVGTRVGTTTIQAVEKKMRASAAVMTPRSYSLSMLLSKNLTEEEEEVKIAVKRRKVAKVSPTILAALVELKN